MITQQNKPVSSAGFTGSSSQDALDSRWLKELAEKCGADDAGIVNIERETLRTEAEGLGSLLDGAKSVVSIAVRLNRDTLRSPWMGAVNSESGFANKAVDDAASKLSRHLCTLGIRSVAVHAAFPMDMQKWPGKMWPVSHKTLAEEAGLGRIGHNRLLIHPRFGASVMLSAVVLNRPVSEYDTPLPESPCNGCKLCVAACPTGSIRADGSFSFVNCATHNYRYRLGGFCDWIENVVESSDRFDYRKRVQDPETMSMWQALAYGNNYTCLNCLAVCPAGEELASTENRETGRLKGAALARLLKNRGGSIYVIKGSDAENYAEKQFPPERIRRVRSGTRPSSARGFIEALPLVFQPGQSEGLNAVYHFDFTGEDHFQATVIIRNRNLTVAQGLQETPDLSLTADGSVWVAFLNGEINRVAALLRRRICIKGSPSLLKRFARCFPG